MTRVRSPNRNKAYDIFASYNGNITSKEIAKLLDEKLSNINNWRSLDKWNDKLNGKVGAPYGNKNSVGNKGGGAPKENQNNRRHGLYSKYLPKAVYNIFENVDDMSPLDILWDSIKLKFVTIINSQKIMYVKSKKDMTKEAKRSKIKTNNRKTDKVSTNSSEEEYEYELQFAWDKQERFLKAQSIAMSTLTKMINEYDDLLHKNWDLATEEQKLRIEKLKGEVLKLNSPDDNDTGDTDDGFIEALNGTAKEDWSDEEEN